MTARTVAGVRSRLSAMPEMNWWLMESRSLAIGVRHLVASQRLDGALVSASAGDVEFDSEFLPHLAEKEILAREADNATETRGSDLDFVGRARHVVLDIGAKPGDFEIRDRAAPRFSESPNRISQLLSLPPADGERPNTQNHPRKAVIAFRFLHFGEQRRERHPRVRENPRQQRRILRLDVTALDREHQDAAVLDHRTFATTQKPQQNEANCRYDDHHPGFTHCEDLEKKIGGVGKVVPRRCGLFPRSDRILISFDRMAKQALAANSNITPRDGTEQASSPQSESEGFASQTGPRRSLRRKANPKDSPARRAIRRTASRADATSVTFSNCPTTTQKSSKAGWLDSASFSSSTHRTNRAG